MTKAQRLAKGNNTVKETETEKFYMMLLRDMGGTDANYKAGALWPIDSFWHFVRDGKYIQRAGNGPDCGFEWTIGVDCVMVKRTRKQSVEETYEVV